MSSKTLTDAERRVSQRLSRGFAWPTVLLLVALIAIEVAVIAAWVVGVMPLVAGVFINSVASYGLYTVVHEAVHRSISNHDPKYARWDSVCGNIAGHLIHHLYPSIPWYRYRAAHRELAPLLSERGAVVAGPSSDPRVSVRFR